MSADNPRRDTSIPGKYKFPQANMSTSNNDVKTSGHKAYSTNIPHRSPQPYGQTSTETYGDLNNQGTSIPNKYSNIKPAISIKPKPVPIAVSTPSNAVTTTNFNMNSKSTLKSDISLNINTSKKWVLPPRPRPGRKPTATQREDSGNDLSTNVVQANVPANIKPNRNNAKKKIKLGNNESIKIESCEKSLSSPNVQSLPNSISHNTTHVEPSDPDQITDLKMNYLSKLKEQELIRNYIEVINNQIKELRFVQNGVITFDALNSDNDIKPQKMNHSDSSTLKGGIHPKSIMTQYEQLEKINNLNDLNKFLAYLTRSSNIIHSATKKFIGDNTNDGHLNSQIQNYVDIRATYKLSRNQELREIEKAKQEKRTDTPDSKMNTTTKNRFIPSLLKPLNENMESQDEISVNVVEEDQNFTNQGGFLDRLMIRDEHEEDIIRSNEVTHEYDEIRKPITPKGISLKKLKSFSCGFCTNDSCLCLDTELELNRLKKQIGK